MVFTKREREQMRLYYQIFGRGFGYWHFIQNFLKRPNRKQIMCIEQLLDEKFPPKEKVIEYVNARSK